MRARALLRLAFVLALALPCVAQESSTSSAASAEIEMELVVERSGPGRAVTVGTGAAQGLAVGDRIAFRGANGDEQIGEVVRIDAASALVRFPARGPLPQPGASGVARIPRERIAPPAPPPARERRLELRVSESGPGARVRIDRGRADGLAVGDRVQFAPRNAPPRAGSVALVDERSAEVVLDGEAEAPAAGTRGEVHIASERLPATASEPAQAPSEVETLAQDPRPQPSVDAPPAPPPQDRVLELRASSVGPGAVAVVDRGAADGLRAGDRVRFTAASGERTEGVVVRLGNKTAVLDLDPNQPAPAVGARGEATIPGERSAALSAPKPSEHDSWQHADEGYTADMPLLTQVKAVRPEERPAQLSGFGYGSGQYRFTDESGRSDSFFRTGGGFELENPFGSGGRVQFDAELNYRTTSVPDEADDDSLHLRVDRLSYAQGGDRFSRSRFELGRFLQNGMPEFGILDGVEWGLRTAGGDRFGASAGFVPEPNASLSTGRDFQLAAWYELVSGDREELALAGGFQKTFHDGDADRDLFVARMNYLPLDAWDLRATAWIDIYGSSDTVKGSGAALSQAWVQTGRLWSSGNGLDFAFRHVEVPEVKSDQHVPISATTLADGRYDRLSGSGWCWLGDDQRLHGEVGGWVDEDETGGDAQLGIELREILLRGARADLSGFGSLGRYSSVVGGRASLGRAVDGGFWELLYEFSAHTEDGFTADFGDVFQHRVRASRDFDFSGAWRLSLYADGLLWDDHGSVSLGFYLQKSF